MISRAPGGPNAPAVPSSCRRPTVMVARPAARRLRPQLTSPKGLISPRLPEFSQIVTGVERGKPLLRPRTVMSTSGPIGTPAAKRSLAMGLKNGTQDGTRLDLARAGMMRNLLTQRGDPPAL